MKAMMALGVITAALMGTATAAEANTCSHGRYEYRTVSTRQWVPGRTERYQAREWVPGQTSYRNQTVVVRAGYWHIDNCGQRQWIAPITRVIQVRHQTPGCYQLVWKTRTLPGCWQNVNQRQRVWVAATNCHCSTRPARRHNRDFRRGLRYGHRNGVQFGINKNGVRVKLRFGS